jgi:NAD(P)-dependent dehydrogenase (short-subunit alcohol dehydrogenase family)
MTRNQSRWTADRIPDQSGRTVVVTGANSGLGFESAKALAAHGARVIMAVRTLAKGQSSADAIRGGQPGADLQVRRLDLADLDSVRSFVDGLRGDGLAVDVLINNAGVMMPPRILSPQGHESQFASNHLGHFALTGLLLDLLPAYADARVVTVSSNLHRSGRIHFDDLTGARGYSPSTFYSQSKLANVLFGLELDRRLRAAGRDIKSVLAHPGFSATNLQTAGPTGMTNLVLRLVTPILAQPAERGALDQLYAATEPSVHSGQFIGPDGRSEGRGYPTVVQPVESAKDPELARRLWTLSEELTGVDFHLPPAP